MRVVVITPPARRVVDLEEVKHRLRVDTPDDDTLIEGLIDAVTEHLDGPDGWLGRSIGVQELEATFDAREAVTPIALPCAPVREITGVAWTGRDGAMVEGDVADVEVLGDRVYDNGAAPWSGLSVDRGRLVIRYRAGWQVVPAPIRTAIVMMVGDMYRFRETVAVGVAASAVPIATLPIALLTPYRVWR